MSDAEKRKAKMEARHPRCKRCGRKARRDERHDAFFCPDCNCWLEEVCGDAACDFCKNRPRVPFCTWESRKGVRRVCVGRAEGADSTRCKEHA
jgi:hypothetical protein